MHKRFHPLCEASDLTGENSAQFHSSQENSITFAARSTRTACGNQRSRSSPRPKSKRDRLAG